MQFTASLNNILYNASLMNANLKMISRSNLGNQKKTWRLKKYSKELSHVHCTDDPPKLFGNKSKSIFLGMRVRVMRNAKEKLFTKIFSEARCVHWFLNWLYISLHMIIFKLWHTKWINDKRNLGIKFNFKYSQISCFIEWFMDNFWQFILFHSK